MGNSGSGKPSPSGSPGNETDSLESSRETDDESTHHEIITEATIPSPGRPSAARGATANPDERGMDGERVRDGTLAWSQNDAIAGVSVINGAQLKG